MFRWTWKILPLLPCFLQRIEVPQWTLVLICDESFKALWRSRTAYPKCWQSPSSHYLKTHERSCFHALAWPAPQSECSRVCESPPDVWRCLIYSGSCSALELSCLFVTVTHLLEANVCDIPQNTFQCVGPLSVTQRILLSANDINVMWNMICSVVLCLPQTLTLKPRINVVGRTSITCGFGDLFLDNQLLIIQRNRSVNVKLSLPIFQVPINTLIMSGSGFSECLFFICWSSWQKPSLFWSDRNKYKSNQINLTQNKIEEVFH